MASLDLAFGAQMATDPHHTLALEYFLNHIREAVVTLDREWRFVYLNRVAMQLTNRPAIEVLGKVIWEVFPQAVGTAFDTEFHRVAADRQDRHFVEYDPQAARWLEVDAYPAENGLVAIVRDITEERKKEVMIQNRVGQLQLLFELAGAVSRAKDVSEICHTAVEGLVRAVGADRASVLIFDDDGVARFKAWVGLSADYRAAVEGHTPWARSSVDVSPVVVPDVQNDPSVSIFREAFANEGIRSLSFIPLMGKSGLIGKFVLYHNQPHEYLDEELQVAQTIANHVGFAAERQRADAALRASQGLLAFAQSAAHLGAWDWDLRTDRIKASGEYERLHGLPPGHPELTHAQWLAMVHPDDRERMRAAIRESLERTHSWDVEFRVVWPDGSVHWLLAKGKVYVDDAGQPVRMAGVSLDATERKQAEAALLESEERFRNMADTAPVMIWVAGPDKVLTFFNKTWLDYVGRTLDQELNNGWVQSVHPEDLDRVYASYSSAFDARESFHIEYRLRRADGEYRWVLCTGVPRFAPGGVFAGYIGSDIDISDLRRAQAEDFERQKLESLGVLSGGIAHDFNNLLGSILVDAELAEADLLSGSPSVDQLRRIKAVALRASEIVRELMIYSGQDKAELGPVDLSQLVADMLELLKVSISKSAVLETNLPMHLPAVKANAAQLRQVVMNLLINASEAIGDKHGVIRVTTSLARGSSGPAEGDSVLLEVSDTGCGMTEEQKARIFDPFFTTKFAGRGLGMAVVQSIVRAHDGSIQLASAPGQGSSFRIILPRASMQAGSPHPAPRVSVEDLPALSAGTMLLVEDEEMLRVSLSKMLRRKGFAVIEAADGSTAIAFFQAHPDQIDLILLDVTIAGRSSHEVLAEVRRIRPGVRVILTSAYSREIAMSSLDPQSVDAFIRKPFLLADLLDLVHSTLVSRNGA